MSQPPYKSGDEVVVLVGRHTGCQGRVLDRTGSGLFRVQIHGSEIVFAARFQHIRHQTDAEKLATAAREAGVEETEESAAFAVLKRLRNRAQDTKGVTSNVWYQAAQEAERIFKDHGILED